MNATYTKLSNGTWGIRVSGIAVEAGTKITVCKQSGETKSEQVERVLWTGPDRKTGETVRLCSIAARSSSSEPSRRYGRGHGSAASVPGYSSYCTANDYCRCYDCAS